MPTVVPDTLHPELQQAWDEIKREAADLYDPVIQAHHTLRENVGNIAAENLAGDKPEFRRNAKRYAQAVFDFTVPQPDNPTEIALALLPAFTKLTGASNMATGLMREMGEVAHPSAIKRLIGEAADSFHPRMYEPVRGPYPNLIDESNPGWTFWSARELGKETPMLTFPARRVHQDLKDFGGKGSMDPFLWQKANLHHELGGHQFSEFATDDVWRRIFGLSQDQPVNLYGTGLSIPPQMKLNMLEDLKHLQAQGLPLQPFALSPGRIRHWTNNYHPDLRIGEELIGDLNAAIAVGGDPYKLMSKTIVDREPILENLKLKEAMEIAKQYGRK